MPECMNMAIACFIMLVTDRERLYPLLHPTTHEARKKLFQKCPSIDEDDNIIVGLIGYGYTKRKVEVL